MSNFIKITDRISLHKIGASFSIYANGGADHSPEFVSSSIHFGAAEAIRIRDGITAMLTPEEAADPQAANEPEPVPPPPDAPAPKSWPCMVKSENVIECPKGNNQCDTDGFCLDIPF